MIQVGSEVKWSSQSQGCITHKTGTVIAIVPAGTELRRAGLKQEVLNTFLKGAGPGMNRNHESYVVHVQAALHLKGKYYWPRVSQLKEII